MSNASAPLRFRWGIFEFGFVKGTEHYLVAGATGSGKTMVISMLMKTILAGENKTRALIYDPKQDIVSTVFGCVGDEASRVKILHPFDDRGCAWDIAADIDDPISARQFATILVPDETGGGDSGSFFSDAVRDLLAGVLLAFVRCVPKGSQWTFRDVILTMLYQPYLEAVLGQKETNDNEAFPLLWRLKDSYLQGDQRTNKNIRASINSKLSHYEPLAAAWHHAMTREDEEPHRSFSLSSWIKEGCKDVLILGNDEAARAAIDPINRAIFKRATELLLAKKEDASIAEQTWILLDEVREAGELDGLSRLMTKGRSKGACVVLGFQDIDGMKAVYGEEVAREICGQCGNTIVLRLASPGTAEWAVQLFGDKVIQSRSGGHTLDTSGVSVNRNRSEEVRSLLQTSDFLYLPKPTPKTSLTGIYKLMNMKPIDEVRHEIPADEVAKLLPPRDSKRALDGGPQCNFKERSKQFRYLKPWDEEDWERLGLKGSLPVIQSAEMSPEAPKKSLSQTVAEHMAKRKNQ